MNAGKAFILKVVLGDGAGDCVLRRFELTRSGPARTFYSISLPPRVAICDIVKVRITPVALDLDKLN